MYRFPFGIRSASNYYWRAVPTALAARARRSMRRAINIFGKADPSTALCVDAFYSSGNGQSTALAGPFCAQLARETVERGADHPCGSSLISARPRAAVCRRPSREDRTGWRLSGRRSIRRGAVLKWYAVLQTRRADWFWPVSRSRSAFFPRLGMLAVAPSRLPQLTSNVDDVLFPLDHEIDVRKPTVLVPDFTRRRSGDFRGRNYAVVPRVFRLLIDF